MDRRIVCAGVVAFGLMAACGCDPAEESVEAGATLRPGSGSGGVWLNTNAIGAHFFSELDLTKAVHDDVRLDRVRLKRPGNVWLELDQVWASAGQIRGKKGTTTYQGADFLGSRWDLTLFHPDSSSTSRTMWVDAYTTVTGEAPRYAFKYAEQVGDDQDEDVDDEEDGDPLNDFVCDADVNGDFTLVALGDVSVDQATGEMTTRANTLYLACTSGAVGKAVTWGYTPWDRGLGDFEGAVRAVRADYCGDGVSWTQPGTGLQVADVWGINAFFDDDAPTEALWSADGALCLAQTRVVAAPVVCGGQTLPACAATDSLATRAGATVWTKIPPQ